MKKEIKESKESKSKEKKESKKHKTAEQIFKGIEGPSTFIRRKKI